MKIVELTPERVPAYEALLAQEEGSLFYASDLHRRLLARVLDDAEEHYLLALEDDQVVGALPLYRCVRPGVGTVINSLPYFGSHGGVIQAGARAEVVSALLGRLDELAHEHPDAPPLSATLTLSPFLPPQHEAERGFSWDLEDDRIGQVTTLPEEASEEALFAIMHSKTRNMVRKAMKQGLEIRCDQGPVGFELIERLHRARMEELRGHSKPSSFFRAVEEVAGPDDYRIYVASLEGKDVGVLLLFYYDGMVEYYLPAAEPEARSAQPLSGLIFRAMLDAVERGYRTWNWGGTWRSQTGVYRFKSRWGAVDMPYRYLTKLYAPDLPRRDLAPLQQAFPYFYLYPFSAREGS